MRVEPLVNSCRVRQCQLRSLPLQFLQGTGLAPLDFWPPSLGSRLTSCLSSLLDVNLALCTTPPTRCPAHSAWSTSRRSRPHNSMQLMRWVRQQRSRRVFSLTSRLILAAVCCRAGTNRLPRPDSPLRHLPLPFLRMLVIRRAGENGTARPYSPDHFAGPQLVL